MPNRILRDGIKTSEAVVELSWRARWFFVSLLVTVDDFGCYDGRAKVLRSALYPMDLDKMSEQDVESCLASCEEAGLVRLYYVQGKRYVEVLNFRQQVRAKSRRWPAPCEADAQQVHSTCLADAQHVHSVCTLEAEAKAEANNNNDGKVSGSATVDVGAEPGPPPSPDEGEFRRWLAAMCSCVPQLAAFRALPQDVVEAAREAFRCLPGAVEHVELLRAYYASKLHEDRRRMAFWRPMGAQFFRELGDVVFKHAFRWQREAGWKPSGGARAAKAAPSVEGEVQSVDENLSFISELRKEVGL